MPTKPSPKPIAVYLRVSSKDQKHDSQREAIGTWLEANGFDKEKIEWYADVETGRTMRRPEFERLEKAIFAGEVKTVIVFKVDRLARRLRDGLNLLCDWADRGVRFVSITQQVDISGTMGKMIASLLLGLAELEWEYIHERQAAGIVAAKKRGVYKGGKPGRRKGDPERAGELAAKGLAVAEIAKAMGTSGSTVYRYLGGKRARLKGEIVEREAVLNGEIA